MTEFVASRFIAFGQLVAWVEWPQRDKSRGYDIPEIPDLGVQIHYRANTTYGG